MPADLDTLRRRLTPAQGAGSASQCDCADAADAVFELWLSEAAGFAQSRSSSQPDSAAVPAGQGGDGAAAQLSRRTAEVMGVLLGPLLGGAALDTFVVRALLRHVVQICELCVAKPKLRHAVVTVARGGGGGGGTAADDDESGLIGWLRDVGCPALGALAVAGGGAAAPEEQRLEMFRALSSMHELEHAALAAGCRAGLLRGDELAQRLASGALVGAGGEGQLLRGAARELLLGCAQRCICSPSSDTGGRLCKGVRLPRD
jgi:hypothetical protein